MCLAKAALKVARYWTKPVAGLVLNTGSNLRAEGKTKSIVVSALLSAIAAILQSAGALGGPGFAVSALVTLPIAAAALLAVHTGIMAYAAAICLLIVLQPSEIIVFSFTTGLLGLGIGFAFRLFKKRAAVVAFAALCLTAGIALLLYIIKFPVLGTSISKDFNAILLPCIYVLSYAYSWLWVEISIISLKFIGRISGGSAA